MEREKPFTWTLTPEQKREFINNVELKKDWEERSLPNSLAQQAENNFRDKINPRARQAEREQARTKAEEERRKSRLIKESNQLELWEHDYPAEIQQMMGSRAGFKKGRWSQAEHGRRYARRTTGWGRFGSSTKEKEGEKMYNWNRHTRGTRLDKTPPFVWDDVLTDKEINESIKKSS